MSMIFNYLLFALGMLFIGSFFEEVAAQYNGGGGAYRRFDGLARVYGPNRNLLGGTYGGGPAYNYPPSYGFPGYRG